VIQRYPYSLADYPWPATIQALYDVPLTLLHESYDVPLVTQETDQATQAHQAVYKMLDDERAPFWALYQRFLTNVIAPYLTRGEYLVQRRPNLRIQFPKNRAVGEWHRDRDYGHQGEERNFWLPLTPVSVENCVWIKLAWSRFPMVVQPGQVLEFDGANLVHGNRVSQATTTRVSLDFRVLARASYRPGPSTVNGVSRFKLGEYWRAL
jgi:hypothetical protein